MFKRFISVAVPVFALSLFSTSARANDMFTLTYIPTGVTDTFTLPSSPTVASDTSYSFTLNNVPVTSLGTTFMQSITFYDGIDGGAFAMTNLGYLYGPQLYTGSLSNPTLVTGPFVLTDDYLPDYSLTVTPLAVTNPTPEPSSLLLLGTGAVGVGSSLLRRRRKA